VEGGEREEGRKKQLSTIRAARLSQLRQRLQRNGDRKREKKATSLGEERFVVPVGAYE